MANRLNQEKSPYLQQHSNQPVDWYPWGTEAFRRAAQEEKPVFLSIGYSTCHWCHVMAHESFEDVQVAQRLNQDFVCIKVDREERPDIDAIYMTACQAMTGSGGWPLTIFMTPDQKPFFAGTYFPKRGSYGLIELLERVSFLWKNHRSRLLQAGNQIAAMIGRELSSGQREPGHDLVEQAYTQLTARFDAKWGGFGHAPKFPAAHNLMFLMWYAAAMQEPDARNMATVTLEDMARGGIQDQIGGGFSRYSTDEMWLVPHFEKMLYDNALLLIAYTLAYQETDSQIFSDTGRRTAAYLLRELSGKEGGLCCGQDADSEGEEGKYYVFTPREIQNVLGAADAEEFCRLYDISQPGNFEGKSIPNRIRSMADGWQAGDPRLEKLYQYRRNRMKLHRDDKILLAWNAWAVLALAKAGYVLEENAYLEAAFQIEHFLSKEMTGKSGRLYLRWRQGEAAHAGQLEDYAVYALALLELYRVTFDAVFLQKAIFYAGQMIELFEDQENGGFYMTASDSEQLIARPKQVYDGAMPSGNAVAALVMQRLARLTGAVQWMDAAQRQLDFLARTVGDDPGSSCFCMLAMIEALYPHKELVCVSRDGIPEPLQKYLKRHAAQNLTVVVKLAGNEELLGQCAPFTRDYPIPEEGTVYYLCEHGACREPVKSFEALNLE